MLAFFIGLPLLAWVFILSLIFIVDVAFFAFECYAWSITVMTVTVLGALYLDHHATHWVSANLHQLLLYYIPGYLLVGLGTALVKWILYVAKRVGWIKEAKSQFEQFKKGDIKSPDFAAAAREKATDEIRDKQNSLTRRSGYEDRMKPLSDEEKAALEARIAELTVELKASWDAGLPAKRREAFVDFYKRGFDNGAYGPRASHKTYAVDYTKDTAIVDSLTPRAKDNVGKITIWIYQWPIVIVASVIEDFIIKLAKHFARLLDAMFSHVVRSMVARATKGL